VRDRLDDLGDAAVAVVTFEPPHRAAAYQHDLLAPLTVLVDPERTTYQAYGLTRGSRRQVWGPKVWLEYARLLTRGRRLRRIRDDTRQLGGDVVVDRAGRVAFVHRSHDPTDRPDIRTVVATVRSL
jgi:hypothetical protein